MSIGDLIDKITQAILNLDLKNIFSSSRIFVIIIAVAAMAIILFGFLFSLIPQF